MMLTKDELAALRRIASNTMGQVGLAGDWGTADSLAAKGCVIAVEQVTGGITWDRLYVTGRGVRTLLEYHSTTHPDAIIPCDLPDWQATPACWVILNQLEELRAEKGAIVEGARSALRETWRRLGFAQSQIDDVLATR